MSCVIDLANITVEPRQQSIFYATHDLIVYKERMGMHLAACNGDILSTVRCPSNFRNYECVDLDDVILFIFASRNCIILDKLGNQPIEHQVDFIKFGKITTSILASNDPFGVIFGTFNKMQVQLVNYDFIGDKRIWQSASWKMEKINHICVTEENVYVLFDNAFLACCDIETGETRWTRFETGRISPKLLPYQGGILYACQGVLKHYADKPTTTRIPLTRIHSLEHVVGNKVVLTTEEGKHISCYDLDKGAIDWEIVGGRPILETVPIKGRHKNVINDVLAIRTKDHLALVDITRGITLHHSLMTGLYRIRETENHVLAHKYNNTTVMIAGL